MRPGVSVAALALRHGINANLLRTWMRRHQARPEMGALITVAPLPAFIPVVPAKAVAQTGLPGLTNHLANRVRLEVGPMEAHSLAMLLQHLHALPYSASTRD